MSTFRPSSIVDDIGLQRCGTAYGQIFEFCFPVMGNRILFSFVYYAIFLWGSCNIFRGIDLRYSSFLQGLSGVAVMWA